MLVTCGECGHPVSDKAQACPSCGYPLKKARSRSPSRMRLPNGFGSITRVKRSLRKPYLARVTNAKDDLGRPVLKSLGYFKTYNEAYTALLEYNKDPYDLDALLSVSEAYKAYKSDVFDKENHSAGYVRAVERAFEQSEILHEKPIRSVRPRHIKKVLESIDGSHAKANCKNFWNRLFDYALSCELVERNYAREFDLDPETSAGIKNNKQAHLAFTEEEMRALWKNSQEETIRAVLVQCYMGWRPNELCQIELSDVDLTLWTIRGGSKTEAGMGRVIPIHSAVRPLVVSMYNEAVAEGRTLLYGYNYYHYHHAVTKLLPKLGLKEGHRPHDPRKQFVTMALKAGGDPMAVKRIVGHKISDITEAAYTERDIEWLRADIEKIDARQYTNSVQTDADL